MDRRRIPWNHADGVPGGRCLGASYLALPLLARIVLAGVAAIVALSVDPARDGKRLHRIEEQLPDALDLMSRALRAGHAFPTALKMVGDEMNDPLASEFRATFDEVNFGISTADALTNLATRVPSTDLRYFVIAVMIQRETGGNLSELLDSISAIIRDRIKLLGQVRVLSAEGKMSAWVLGAAAFRRGGHDSTHQSEIPGGAVYRSGRAKNADGGARP